MATPHMEAELGEIAKTVLMPGDPLRAEWIAGTFLEGARLVNRVRNICAYTGTYQGREITVMGSGMGMPSIGIYSYELYQMYEVETIIRVGTAGAYVADLNLYDVVLAESAWSASSYGSVQNGDPSDIKYPDKELNDRLLAAAGRIGIPLIPAKIQSGDVFYRESGVDGYREYYKKQQCLCGDMESFALFHNADVLGRKAACLLTISDSLPLKLKATAKERQTSFADMVKIALEACCG